jgi:xanthine/uracil permease
MVVGVVLLVFRLMIRNFVPNLWSKKLNPPRIGVVLTVVSFSFSKAAIINKTLQREEQNAKKFSLFLSLFLSLG